MPYLILVKHSLPDIAPDVPAASWRLSDEGRKRCLPLANALAAYNPDTIVTSREPKAIETGQLVAARLGLPCQPWDDLHEHLRLTAPFTSRQEFDARIARFFAEPDQLVLGEETAAQASARFGGAIADLLRRYPQQTLIVISHGTVISLFFKSITTNDPYPLWRKLDLPAYVVFSLPGLEWIEVGSNELGNK
jgi:broad specificity phosphatase PhoE